MDSNSDCESGIEHINILRSAGLKFRTRNQPTPLSFGAMWNGSGLELIRDERTESRTKQAQNA